MLIRGNIYEAQERTSDAIDDYKNVLARDPFDTASRDALQRLGQEVPEEQGDALAVPVSGWVIKEPAKGRYIASNPKYPSLRADLKCSVLGKPKILEWTLLKDALAGIGLLRYYAGDLGDSRGPAWNMSPSSTPGQQSHLVEPHAWGDTPAQWNWQAVSVVVTDPDGNKNEVQLRKVRQRAPARDDFWGFDRPDTPPADTRRAARRGGQAPGGGGGGMFGWLFH